MAELTKIGQDFLVNRNVVGIQHRAEITTLSDGRLLVVWASTRYSETGQQRSVQGRIFTAEGEATGGEFTIGRLGSPDSLAHVGDEIVVQPTGDGGFAAAWRSGPNQSPSSTPDPLLTSFARFDASAARIGSEQVIGRDAELDKSFALATFGDGKILLAHAAPTGDGSGSAIIGHSISADGAPAAAPFVINASAPGDQVRPAATTLSDGRIVAAWADRPGGAVAGPIPSDIKARILSSDGAMGAEFTVNTTLAGVQDNPSVFALAGGRFVVVWRELGGVTLTTPSFQGDGIKAQIFDADGAKVGGAIDFFSGKVAFQQLGDIEALPDGGFLATWDEDRSIFSLNGHWLARYDANGARVGDPVKVRASDDLILRPDGKAIVAGDGRIFGGRSPADVGYQVYDLATGTLADGMLLGDTSRSRAYGDAVGAGDRLFFVWSQSDFVGDYDNLGVVGTVLAAIDPVPVPASEGPDTIAGSAASEVISALGGADVVTGGGGYDTIRGGAGSDTLTGGDQADVIVGQGGGAGAPGDVDSVNGGAGRDLIGLDGPGRLLAFGSDGGDGIRGGDQTAPGGDVVDYLFGEFGNDTVMGGAGSDAVVGSFYSQVAPGAPTVDNGDFDVLLGEAGDDYVLQGWVGRGFLDGGDGDDTIVGGFFQDVIRFGKGEDWAYGGAGEDYFALHKGDLQIGSFDVIMDFNPAQDLIVLVNGLSRGYAVAFDVAGFGAAVHVGVPIPTIGPTPVVGGYHSIYLPGVTKAQIDARIVTYDVTDYWLQ